MPVENTERYVEKRHLKEGSPRAESVKVFL